MHDLNRSRVIAAIAAAMSLTAGVAHADDLRIPWSTLDGGGGTSSGGAFTLSGTIGQPDAGAMSGGAFSLTGGFWGGDADGGPPCPADLDESGDVGFGDLLLVLAAWGNTEGPEDLDASGFVDFGDLLIVLSNWGACP